MKRKSLKKLLSICCAVLLAGSLAGCTANGNGGDASQSSVQESTEKASQESGQESSQSTTPEEEGEFVRLVLNDLDVDKYVKIGDYSNFRVAKEEVVVTQEEIDDVVDSVYLNFFPEELGVKDRAVIEGDTANIDYEGKKDGVAFDGGTAQGSNLTIGSGQFIDGFEDGLIGVKPGETVDLNLTFPEAYHNEELAGQAVVFTVTVNYIIPAEKMDEAIPSIGIDGVETVAQLNDYVKDYITMTKEETNGGNYSEQVITEFMDLCEFEELPADMVASYRAKIKQNISDAATNAGTDANTYISAYYGMDLEGFLDIYVEDALRQNIAMQALANKEGLRVEDDELQATLEEYASETGMTVEQFLGGDSEEDFREYLMYENVSNYLISLASGEQ